MKKMFHVYWQSFATVPQFRRTCHHYIHPPAEGACSGRGARYQRHVHCTTEINWQGQIQSRHIWTVKVKGMFASSMPQVGNRWIYISVALLCGCCDICTTMRWELQNKRLLTCANCVKRMPDLDAWLIIEHFSLFKYIISLAPCGTCVDIGW